MIELTPNDLDMLGTFLGCLTAASDRTGVTIESDCLWLRGNIVGGLTMVSDGTEEQPDRKVYAWREMQ